MNRTSTKRTARTAVMALALVSSVASISTAQYRAKNTFARVDTTTRTTATIARDSNAVPAAKQSPRAPGKFYIGLAAGASMPSGEFRNDYRDGWSAAVPIGWHPANGPLGMRLDVAYSKWGGETVGGVKLESAAVWDGMLDATVDMPFGANKTSSFYLLGGGGVHYFPSYGSESYAVGSDTTTRTPPPEGTHKSIPSRPVVSGARPRDSA